MHRSAAEQAVRWQLPHGGERWAGLNFRDCFSYALAKLLGEPLLYTGEDFARTDVDAVAIDE